MARYEIVLSVQGQHMQIYIEEASSEYLAKHRASIKYIEYLKSLTKLHVEEITEDGNENSVPSGCS